MASHLDLEEQEQLDQLKHFWKKHGNWITWALTLVLAAYAGWNFYQYWQKNEAVKAAALFDEMGRAVTAQDASKLDRVLQDIREKHAQSVYAAQAALLAAKFHADKGKAERAKAYLTWIVEKSTDLGYQSIAKLRLASVLVDMKDYSAAEKLLDSSYPPEFTALALERLGDVHQLSARSDQAKAAYLKAWDNLSNTPEYRRLLAVKLNALGVDVQSMGKTSPAVTPGVPS